MKTAMPQFLIAILIVCLVSVQNAQAVSPPPDGGYPGQNTAEGQNALLDLNVNNGTNNTAVGWLALRTNVDGDFNTAIGSAALATNTGDGNTAIGGAALFSNTTGDYNMAAGLLALYHNTAGTLNTALGASALQSNQQGISNTAAGYQALYVNDSSGTGHGSFNSAFGAFALTNNDDGEANCAFGTGAMEFNQNGQDNVAVGTDALSQNLIGSGNTAIGTDASEDQTGDDNTALGAFALLLNTTGNANTANGSRALQNTTGSRNIGMGFLAGCALNSGDNNIIIGNSGVVTESNTIRIGTVVAGMNCSDTQAAHTATYIAGISGTAVVGDPVVVDENGQLGTATSSQQFKKGIRPMDKTSEAILALKPVTFQYKADSKNTPQFGLIAEDVAKVNPDLVVRNRNGEIYSVRYDQVNAMLLNEFLKEHRTVREQGATIAELKKQIETLTAGLQEVSAQLEVNKPASQVAENNQ
jgi:hypothetical protein